MSKDEAAEKRLRAIKNVLTSNYADLASFIEAASPLCVGEKLVTAHIVTAEALKGIQHLDPANFAFRLLSSAITMLEYESEKFRKFIAILFQFEPSRKLASKMCQDMEKGERFTSVCCFCVMHNDVGLFLLSTISWIVRIRVAMYFTVPMQPRLGSRTMVVYSGACSACLL